jgi:hypothetical protein
MTFGGSIKMPNIKINKARAAELALCLVVGAIVSVLSGQDANWDLRNYHLYTPYSLMAGVFDRNILPADIQSAFNPTLDFPYVWLALGPLSDYPRLLAAFMGLWFGGLIFIVLRMAAFLYEDFPKSERPFFIGLGTLTAVTGAATFSYVGTTTNDIQISLLLIGGLLCVLKAIDKFQKCGVLRLKPVLAAGVLFGLAAGLKLTGGPYAAALCLALLFVLKPGLWLRCCAVFSGGWGAGFLAAYGWWGWMLWARYGSPTFPYLNDIFHSPMAPPLNVTDTRFLPFDLVHWLFFPFFWVWDTGNILYTSHYPFHDPRMAIAYVAFVFLAGAVCVSRLRRKPPGASLIESGLTKAQKTAIWFIVFSYIAWLLYVAYIRYAQPVEIMGLLITPIALMALARYLPHKNARSLLLSVCLFACVATLVSTRHMYVERVAYGDKTFAVDMSWTQPDTLFVGVIGPVAYLAAFVPPQANAQFVGFGYVTVGAHEWPIGRKIENTVRTHKGPVIVLFTEDMRDYLGLLVNVGLSPDLGACRTVASNLDVPLGKPVFACEAAKIKDSAQSRDIGTP